MEEIYEQFRKRALAYFHPEVYSYSRGQEGKKVVYNHFDSYLDGVGKDLITDWNDDNLAKDVVLFGKYNREGVEYEFNSVDEWIEHLCDLDREYAYLWDNDCWKYISADVDWQFTNNWKKVEDELK